MRRCLLSLLVLSVLPVCRVPVTRAEPEDVPAAPEQVEQAPAAADTEAPETESPYEQIELLTQALLHIKNQYVEELSYEEIMYGALHGMMDALDSHSTFLEPEALDDMEEETEGKYSGIGIHIGIRDGVLTVISPIEDTPAFRAGLQSGDRITEIEGERTLGITLSQAVKRLRGPKGEKVTITIRREGVDAPETIEIVRDDIEVPTVKGTRIIRDGIGYVRITQFSLPTADDLQKALNDLLAQDMKALVLDLRSNPGGLLSSAIAVSQKFLPRGDLIVSTRSRARAGEDSKRAWGDLHYTDFPMAILVNEGSASASEIVAGALQDHKRAVLVGGVTFGKGSVQSVIRLEANRENALRLTTARYYTPSGRQIHDSGIEPDIPVYVSPEEWRRIQVRRAHVETPEHFSDEEIAKYEDAVDRPLERALDLLQAIAIFKR